MSLCVHVCVLFILFISNCINALLQWYKVDEDILSDPASRFYIRMSSDAETEEFLEKSSELSNDILTQIFHSVVKFILGFFMTQTSING